MTDRHLPFTRHLAGKGLAERTQIEYRKWVARAERWLVCNEDTTLPQCQPWQIRAWCDADVPDTWSSRKQARTALGHWQDFAGHDDDLAGAVPCPRKPKARPKPLDATSAKQLEAEAFALVGTDDYLNRAGMATCLGLYLGMRRVEIARANWASDAGDEWVWRRAKTGDVAALPIHPRLRDALDRYESASALLFVGRYGDGPVATNTIWQWVRDVAARVDIDVSTHQLRHTAITRVVDAQGIRVGQEYAGHRDPEVTAGYSLVREDQLHDAVASLDFAS